MSFNTHHFGISSKLQEVLCLLGQGQVFEEGEALLDELLGVSVSAKQIQRVSEYYGEQIELSAQANETPVKPAQTESSPVYLMMDGSMIYTREDGWKEMKVGRIFSADDLVKVQPERNQLTQSTYVCHLGDHKAFLKKLETYTSPCKKKICIADGAKWIWNWVEDSCTDTIQILDYFHAVEKIAAYARNRYADNDERKIWMDNQQKRLLQNEVNLIINELKADMTGTKETIKTREDTIRYYENNQNRMQYKTYIQQGYLIGSGAIESAHRNVVQMRLKRSGQRWSTKGAQQIVNLRAYKLSNRWDEVTNLIKQAA
jgi:hypothetical protein